MLVHSLGSYVLHRASPGVRDTSGVILDRPCLGEKEMAFGSSLECSGQNVGERDEEKERAPTKHLRELIQSSSEPCRVNIFIPFTEGKLKLKRDLG